MECKEITQQQNIIIYTEYNSIEQVYRGKIIKILPNKIHIQIKKVNGVMNINGEKYFDLFKNKEYSNMFIDFDIIKDIYFCDKEEGEIN